MRHHTSSSIKDLLSRYTTLLRAPQKTVVEEVVKAYRTLGILCESTDLSYTPSTKTLVIKASGPKKTEMLLRKESLRPLLLKTLSERDVPHHII